MSCFDFCKKGNIFVIVIVFSFVTILVHENKPFCLEVPRVERKEGILIFSVLEPMSTFNVCLCGKRHRFVYPHLNDKSFQLQQPIVFILSDEEVFIPFFV